MKRTILTVALGIAVAALANRQPATAVTSACGSGSMMNDSENDAFDRDAGLDRGGYRAGDAPDDADDLIDDSSMNPNLDRTRPDLDDDSDDLRTAPDQVPGARAPIP